MTDLRRQHQDDVKEIGEKISELVKDAKIKGRFTGQINRLCEKVEKYGQDLQAYQKKQPELSPERKKILATIKNSGQLLKAEEEMMLCDLTHVLPPPPNGFINMCYADYAFIDGSLHFSYRPAKLENPLLWLGIFGNADTQQKPQPEDVLMCDYVKLAVIHDCTVRGVEFLAAAVPDPLPSYPSVWMYETVFPDKYERQRFRREEFRKQVWQHYSHTQIPLVHYVNPLLSDSTFRTEFFGTGNVQSDRELQRELRKKLSELKDAFGSIQTDLDDASQKRKMKTTNNSDFTFNPGQVCYKGKPLQLPSGEAVDIFRKLYDSLGQVVIHKVLNTQSSNSNASDTLKTNIGLIRKTLKQKKTPYRVDTKRGNGYSLMRKK